MIATCARLGAIPILTSLVALSTSPAHGQSDPFHILVTNDDGIESAGIRVLAEQLRAVGEVHVLAPCGERSGSSMSVALRDELVVRPIQRHGDTVEHCVDTTPAGAVMLAITTLSPPGGFDLVVSGINRGANVGTVAHMSGTVGGAMMGAFYGVPSVAASLGGRAVDFDYPARFVAGFVQQLKQRPAMPGVVLSVNIPKATEAEIEGVTVAKMGGSYLRFGYEETQDGAEGRRFQPRLELETSFPEASDSDAYMRDAITVTPLLFDWTAYSALDELRGWSLSHVVQR